MNNRKYYLDNLEAFTILLFFPFHIFMIYNNWGEDFYIRGEALLIPSELSRIIGIWIWPLLLATAGISSRYALEKRNAGIYVKECVSNLLLPLIFGVLLVVPVQPYIAGLYFNGESSYFDFFTRFTDMTGYDGAFTLAHLWFLLYLFLFSMVSLPFTTRYKNKGKGMFANKASLIVVVSIGLLPCIVESDVFKVFQIYGKSTLRYFVFFLLGHFLLANENLLKKLEKRRFLLLGMTVLFTGFMIFILEGEFFEMASWLSILTVLGMAQRYLNFNGKTTDYLSKSSFGVFLFHQSWIIVAAFFVFKITDSPILQIPLIFLSSIILTYLTCEICKRVFIFRRMFGLKKNFDLKEQL